MVDWSDEEIATIKRKFHDGSTSGEIARALGRSRNSIIGKLTRLGLSRGKTFASSTRRTSKKREASGKSSRSHKAKPATQVFPSRRAPLLPPQPIDDAAQVAHGISIFDIGHEQCRWPLNETSPIKDFRFCGLKTFSGCYCLSHYVRAVPSNRQMTAEAAE